MNAATRDALRGARLALSAVQAGWEAAQADRQRYEAANIPLSPVMVESLARMERTVAGAQLAVRELERFADLRADLLVSLRRHAGAYRAGTFGPEWLGKQIAEDLKL